MIQFDDPIVMRMKSEVPGPVFNWEGKKILMVEDDYANFMFLQEMLSCANACLERAVSVQAAFDMISGQSGFDLLIINTNIPGNENCKAVNWFKLIYPTLPILAIADRECKVDNKVCYPLGCDMLISFNIDSHEMIAAVNEILNLVY